MIYTHGKLLLQKYEQTILLAMLAVFRVAVLGVMVLLTTTVTFILHTITQIFCNLFAVNIKASSSWSPEN
jgi:hypothetical protein